jgi:hypothetical protein
MFLLDKTHHEVSSCIVLSSFFSSKSMAVTVREVKDERRPHWRRGLGILLSLKRLRPIGQLDERVKFVKCEDLDLIAVFES